jgi:NAD(P)-dependent dehydrogenase (short-subunit alcohol dehydrogenase family)
MSFVPSLRGRVALVTGAGRGFGERIAGELTAMGAAVGVLDIDGAAAARVAESLIGAVSLEADVGRLASVEGAFAELEERLGPVELLVNNAGIASFTPFLESTEEELDRIFSVNLTGLFNTCRLAAPGMVERGFGRIVNVSSLAGLRGGFSVGRRTPRPRPA